jgi:hypothetical protein
VNLNVNATFDLDDLRSGLLQRVVPSQFRAQHWSTSTTSSEVQVHVHVQVDVKVNDRMSI